MRRLLVLASALVLAPLAVAGQAPQWKLELSLQARSGPSAYRATIVKQLAGVPVSTGRPVTLRLDRRTRCQTDTEGVIRPLLCGPALRSLVAAQGPGLEAIAAGQRGKGTETNTFGAKSSHSKSTSVAT